MSSGSKISKLRRALGWTQKKLAEEAGVDTSILSRIESGKIENPREETLSKLFKALGEPATVHSDHPPLRIGFPHTTWSAPLIEMIMRRQYLQLQLCSYGIHKVGYAEPYMYDLSKLNLESVIKSGPKHSNCSDQVDISKVADWEPQTKLTTYHADDLIALLARNELDGIAIASEVYDGIRSDIIKCIQIMYTVSGGKLLIITRGDYNRFSEAASTQNITKTIMEIGKSKGNVELAYVPQTIAENMVSQHLFPIESQSGFTFRHHPVKWGDWDKFVAEIKAELSKESVIFLLAWEPQISWLCKELSEIADVNFIEENVVSLSGELEYSTYDIIFKKQSPFFSARGKEAYKVIDNFIGRINDNVKIISKIEHEGSLFIKEIATYLDLPTSKCFEDIKRLEFSVMYHPEWVEHLLNMER